MKNNLGSSNDKKITLTDLCYINITSFFFEYYIYKYSNIVAELQSGGLYYDPKIHWYVVMVDGIYKLNFNNYMFFSMFFVMLFVHTLYLPPYVSFILISLSVFLFNMFHCENKIINKDESKTHHDVIVGGGEVDNKFMKGIKHTKSIIPNDNVQGTRNKIPINSVKETMNESIKKRNINEETKLNGETYVNEKTKLNRETDVNEKTKLNGETDVTKTEEPNRNKLKNTSNISLRYLLLIGIIIVITYGVLLYKYSQLIIIIFICCNILILLLMVTYTNVWLQRIIMCIRIIFIIIITL